MRVWDLDDDLDEPSFVRVRPRLLRLRWIATALVLAALVRIAAGFHLDPLPPTYCERRAALRDAIAAGSDAGTTECELVDDVFANGAAAIDRGR